MWLWDATWWAPKETESEAVEDGALGFCFLVLSVWSCYRLLGVLPSLNVAFSRGGGGGGRVISAFYFLIAVTSVLRMVWFLVPAEALEGGYVPVTKEAYVSPHWGGVFASEVILAMGSMFLFSIFILIAAFWAHMLARVDSVDEIGLHDKEEEGAAEDDRDEVNDKHGPLHNFAFMMAALFLIEGANFCLFLLKFYNSDGMILYDSVLLSIVSLATLIEFTIFSTRIQHVLKTISAINANSTTMQRNRILSITMAANLFFVVHFALEVTLSASLVLAWHNGHSFDSVLQRVGWWEVYIRLKHWSEVIVLGMALMVSLSGGPTAGRGQRQRRDYEAIPDADLDF